MTSTHLYNQRGMRKQIKPFVHSSILLSTDVCERRMTLRISVKNQTNNRKEEEEDRLV